MSQPAHDPLLAPFESTLSELVVSRTEIEFLKHLNMLVGDAPLCGRAKFISESREKVGALLTPCAALLKPYDRPAAPSQAAPEGAMLKSENKVIDAVVQDLLWRSSTSYRALKLLLDSPQCRALAEAIKKISDSAKDTVMEKMRANVKVALDAGSFDEILFGEAELSKVLELSSYAALTIYSGASVSYVLALEDMGQATELAGNFASQYRCSTGWHYTDRLKPERDLCETVRKIASVWDLNELTRSPSGTPLKRCELAASTDPLADLGPSLADKRLHLYPIYYQDLLLGSLVLIRKEADKTQVPPKIHKQMEELAEHCKRGLEHIWILEAMR